MGGWWRDDTGSSRSQGFPPENLKPLEKAKSHEAAEVGLCLKSRKRGAAGVDSGGQNQNRCLGVGWTPVGTARTHVKVLERDVPPTVRYVLR